MPDYTIKRNERDWAGQLIGWLKEAIRSKTTVFQDATNDTGVRMESGRTKFPDILLFTDKVAGEVFNGWELKFPDTPVDDPEMLDNALEKARRLNAASFVTWNGAEAVIWKIDCEHYTRQTLGIIKRYPKVSTINSRDDLASPAGYARHEKMLHERAMEILHDLGQLYTSGKLRPAVNISADIVGATRMAFAMIVPQFAQAVDDLIGTDREFREAFHRWKIYESATLQILGTSSRRAEKLDEKWVLAQFAFYNLTGKILFYMTLAENLPGEIRPLVPFHGSLKEHLDSCFEQAGKIDYQAIFKTYFTDSLPFSAATERALGNWLSKLGEFDFRILPAEVIGTILENVVPEDEKQKLGQYFTPTILADLVAYPVVGGRESTLFDPTSGTGSFLTSFYRILSHFGNDSHECKLSQIWGNDVSHFPAILSVINLYKQNVAAADNFPRVTREDFFNLSPRQQLLYPDPHDHNSRVKVEMPVFDGIASNFPFIRQEDIPNEKLTVFFRNKFEASQAAFLADGSFRINERSDYFTYCVYNSIRFLRDGGMLAGVTSNAWLGKEYGVQFKEFLLRNFHIKYVVRSVAEHWSSDSQVSTVFFVLEKRASDEPTRFVTLGVKLRDRFSTADSSRRIDMIEDFYADLDNCEMEANDNWRRDPVHPGRFERKDGSVTVNLIPRDTLIRSVRAKTNWAQFFIAENPLACFEPYVTRYEGTVTSVVRGERTGWNKMFVIPDRELDKCPVNPTYLCSYVKSPSELTRMEFTGDYRHQAFVCQEAWDTLDEGTRQWIDRFRNELNRNGKLTIEQACASHRPYWYSINPPVADIVTAINPYKRMFFTFSRSPFIIDQRLIALRVLNGHDVELVAALLNSVATLLTLEFTGTSRNLGALDLNANNLKSLRLLDPARPDSAGRAEIIEAFRPLRQRKIGDITTELSRPDRIRFDRAVLRAYGLSPELLPRLYAMLADAVETRTGMKDL